jgi:hypothetical protein
LFDATKGLTYGAVVDQFIEQYAKPGQHTWDQTQRVLKNNCADWLTKPIAEITDKDADTLLATFSADKHDYKAALTLRWLRTLWKWAWKKKYVPERVMDRVDFRYKERARDRWYADHEIKAIWNAANKLDPIEGTYVKLLLLLAPRKTALAMMRRADCQSSTTREIPRYGRRLVCARDLFDTVHQGLQLPRRASHDRDVVAETRVDRTSRSG